MPDFAVCNSTLCTVRKNCSRNWDSGLKPDREPQNQQWVTFRNDQYHRYHKQSGPEPLFDTPVTHHEDCPVYLPITPNYPPSYIPARCWDTDPRYAYRAGRRRDGKIDFDKMSFEVRAAFEDGTETAIRILRSPELD